MIEFRIPAAMQRDDSMAHLLHRLAMMVAGEAWFASKDSNEEHDASGANWMLGRANDFFLHRRGPETFALSTRYGTAEMERELTNTAIWLLGVRHAQERIAA